LAKKILPSDYALMITNMGFGIITWSFERTELRRSAAFGGFHAAYHPTGAAALAVHGVSRSTLDIDMLATRGGFCQRCILTS
jgi:hypothetical protein